MLQALLCVVLSGLAPSRARAQDDTPAALVSIFAEGAWAGPYGWAAAGFALRPTSWASIEAGVGHSLGGLQLGAGLGLHYPIEHGDFFGILVAVSQENYVQTGFLSNVRRVWDSNWLYAGLQGRKQLWNILFFRGTMGAAAAIAHGSARCEAGVHTACAMTAFDPPVTMFAEVGFELELSTRGSEDREAK